MDILALRRQGFSLREISGKLGIHRTTVTKYVNQGQAPKYTKVKRKGSILDPYVQLIDEWLSQDNYRASWIYHQIQNLGYPGGYDTVKNHVRKVKKRYQRKAFIRFETVPGLQGQMDWADFQVTAPAGKITTLYLFLLVLGFSRAMYAELVPRCTLQFFMDVHIRAFHYLGGVPLEVLYDNMKHVVLGRSHNKAIFNVEFDHFARHYAFKPVVCPPYSPHVKGKVERPVDYIRESFWRGYRFTTIEQANNDLHQWLNQTANRRRHGTHRQAVDVRWQQELGCLTPCPAADCDTAIKVYRKVYKDCMISYNASLYQVPPDVVGKQILLKVKDDVIRFYDDDRLLATYSVAAQKGTWTTDPTITGQIFQYRQMQQRQRPYGRIKARATRGLVNGSLFPQVHCRPLSVYDQFAQGGGPWTN
ncbi:MAG: IS21 family transposase [Desulfobacteraceae bacterium]